MTKIRLLVTVKAYPRITQHGEAVCVAGVRLDTEAPQWARLFPVPFRDLAWSARFRKYDVIEVDVGPAPQDQRPESLQPNALSIRVIDHLGSDDGWRRRRPYVEPLRVASMCEVARRQQLVGTSLAVFRPAAIEDFVVEAVTPKEAPDQMNLFDPERVQLEPIPHKFRYVYRCAEQDCPGHRQSIIDWELGEAFRSWRNRYGGDTPELHAALRRRWFDEITGSKRDTHLYVGSIAKYPQSFVVLGCYYPPAGTGEQLALA
jgi:hypothetical protein